MGLLWLFIHEIISAGFMLLFGSSSWIFPAHGRPDAVYGANSLVAILIFNFKERTFIQEHAA